MPQVSAAVLRSTPSSTSASASIRRAAALSFSPLAALRSSEAVRSSRVIDTAAPIDAAPLKSQHRVRVSLIWESPMSHSLGPLVSDRFRPAFRECQRRRREWAPLTFPRPGSSRRLDAVADETRAERGDQHGAHAVAPVGNLVRLRVDEQRLADIEPGKCDIFAMRLDVLSPEVAWITCFGELRVRA